MTKEAGLAEQLHYDPYERRSGLVRLLALGTTPEAWASGRATELSDAVEGVFEIDLLEPGRVVMVGTATAHLPDGPAALRIVKEIRIGGDRRTPTLDLAVTVENRSGQSVEALLGLEWTLTMLGGGGNPSAWWEFGDARTAHDGRGVADGVLRFAQGNDYVGIGVETTVSRAATAWWAPVETVSNSEGGFERVYQGSGLLLSWPLALAPGASFSVGVSHVVTTDRDRSADDLATAIGATVRA